MSESLDVLVHRASKLAQIAGLVDCRIESAAERILAYTFVDDEAANRFDLNRSALGMRTHMPPSRPDTVLVWH